MPLVFAGTPLDCPLCGGCEHVVVGTHGRDRRPLRTVCCTGCGLVFTNPRPTSAELEAFYRLAYRQIYKGIRQPKLKHVWRAARRALPRLRRLHRLGVRAGRLLDVGSGGGEFLYLARTAGFSVTGLEPNAGYSEFARREYGLDVRPQALAEAEFSADSFDVITLNHVLEHLPDPVAALLDLRRWLTRDGVLIVEVPNVQARYHAPRTRFHFAHLVNFSRATLAAAAARAGFTPIDIELTPQVWHLDAAFRPVAESSPQFDAAHARAICYDLRAHSLWRHYLSRQPYLRVAQNLVRPMIEYSAVTGMASAQQILERVYSAAGIEPGCQQPVSVEQRPRQG